MNIEEIMDVLMSLVPAEGMAVGNIALSRRLMEAIGKEISEDRYAEVRDALVAAGKLAKGPGRGGSVRRVESVMAMGGGAIVQSATALLELDSVETVVPEPKTRAPRKPKAELGVPHTEEVPIRSYRHQDRRANNPEVGLVKPENDPDQPKTQWAFDPHLDPDLRFDIGRSQVEGVIDQALGSNVSRRFVCMTTPPCA